IAAVDRVAGESRVVAEVLAIAAAVDADAVRPAEPRNADAFPVFSTTDDLVAEDQRQFWIRKFAVDDVQIGATDGAAGDLDENLTGFRYGNGNVAQRELLFENHRSHESRVSLWSN